MRRPVTIGIVVVTHRIAAPAATIFDVLADPRNHRRLDGSGMVRSPVTHRRIRGVGDVFVMNMYVATIGHYQMINHVLDYEPHRRIGWEPRPGPGHPDAAANPLGWGQRWSYQIDPDSPTTALVAHGYDCTRAAPGHRARMIDGRVWLGAMTTSLGNLATLAAGHATHRTE